MEKNTLAFQKAKNNRDKKKKVYNQYSDFSTDLPNHIKVTKKYKNSGNVCLGYAKNAGDWKPWRFGKHSIILHQSTVIQVEGGKTYWLQTANVCDYLRKNKNTLRPLESKGFNGLKTKSYLVKIEELVNYDLQQKYQVAA
jgi:hypothetical protein